MSNDDPRCCVCSKREGIEPAAMCWKCKRYLCMTHEFCACGAEEEPPHTCRCETCGKEMD